MKSAEQILAKLATLQTWAEDGCGDDVVSAYELEAIMQWAHEDDLDDAWLDAERARTVRQADCHYGRNQAKFWAERASTDRPASPIDTERDQDP